MGAVVGDNLVVEDRILNYCMGAVVGTQVVVEDILAVVVVDIQD